jgi:hypothetical protein
MKRVLVQLKDQTVQEYENVSRIEEERRYEHVIAVRLYDYDGELLAILDSDQIANLKSEEVRDT